MCVKMNNAIKNKNRKRTCCIGHSVHSGSKLAVHPLLVTQVGLGRQLNAANEMLLHTLLSDYPHFLTEYSLIHSHIHSLKRGKKREKVWHSVLTQPPAIISAKRGIVSSFSVNLSLTKSFTCGIKNTKKRQTQSA